MFKGVMEEEDDDILSGGSGGGGEVRHTEVSDDELRNDEDDDLDDLDDLDDEDEDLGGGEGKAPSMSPQQIAQLAAEAAMRVGGRQEQQQAPQMTREEMLTALKHYKAPPDLVKLLRDPETTPEKAAEALQALVDGTAAHSIAAMQVLMQQQLSPLHQQMQQQQEVYRERQTRDFTARVEKFYPALKGMTPVIRQAIRNLSERGYNPPSKSAALKAVAKEASRFVQQIKPDFSLKAGGQGGRQAGSLGSRAAGGRARPQQPGGTGASSFVDLL